MLSPRYPQAHAAWSSRAAFSAQRISGSCSGNRAQAIRFAKGLIEGVAYFKKYKKESIEVLQKKLRIQSGESLYIPGGLRHNETAASTDLELLEISVPADMGTVACDPPEGWSPRP